MLIQTSQRCGVILSLTIAMASGCSPKDAASPGEFKTVTVQPVTHYGQVLDQGASAPQVAYVLLRAIHADVVATTTTEREAAIDIQFDLAAADIIRARNLTGLSPDEYVDGVVRHWTPTVSHYANSFESEWGKAQPRLLRTQYRETDLGDGPTKDCEILVELADPSGDPNAQVLMFIWMAKDNDLWRVIHLGFKNNVRSIDGLRALAVAARSHAPAIGD